MMPADKPAAAAFSFTATTPAPAAAAPAPAAPAFTFGAAAPAPAPAESAEPATWTADDFRRYLRKQRPRNRTELRKLNGAVYRQLQKRHPALLEELLPSQRSGAGTRTA